MWTKFEQKHPSSHYIITLTMTPIINRYSNKHPISWDLIHRLILHPSDGVMKSMCRHQTLNGLPKHCPNKINKAPCTIWYTAEMTNVNKGTIFDTINLQPGELIHMEFSFYNVTSISGFISMLTVVCAKTIIIWVFRTAPKRSSFRIILFILTTMNNEQHPCKLIFKSCIIWCLGKLNRCHKLTCWRIKYIHGNYWWWCILDKWK